MSGYCSRCGNTACLCEEIAKARTQRLSDPRWVAWDAVDQMMTEGLKKHRAEGWRAEPQDNHLDKAVRHVMTFKLIRDSNQKPDGENHLRNALCRLAFALNQEIQAKPKSSPTTTPTGKPDRASAVHLSTT
jgi:hypothetical protein